MRAAKSLQHVLVVVTGALLVGAYVLPGHAEPGPVTAATDAAAAAVGIAVTTTALGAALPARPADDVRSAAENALAALASAVRETSHPQALPDAFRSYFAYRAAHPEETKPYLYFVDYGLPATTPRGYVFDMESLSVVDGPFTVAHGRGSAAEAGVPRRFSNAFGSAATSLGLFVAQELYAFRGKTAGRSYRSIGLRLAGVSGRFNANARARGVVAHGAPYVTATGAGRSEGCPALEPERAQRLLPKLAHGGLVFLFAPDAQWLAGDPWLATDAA